jgi:hypothetical protein
MCETEAIASRVGWESQRATETTKQTGRTNPGSATEIRQLNNPSQAGMAELADAADSKADATYLLNISK